MKILINPGVLGNSVIFVPKITLSGSHDFKDVMNRVAHV